MIKKLAYSLGGISTALSYQAFSTYIIFFYVDVMKLPPHMAALAMLIYAIWNALNDPIVGFLSDHTHTAWGRRIPYLAIGAIPFGLAYFFLWIPPFGGLDQVSLLFAYFVLAICLFDGLYTIVTVNWLSLFPEMFSSLPERAEVNSFRQSFSLLGLLLGLVLPSLIYTRWGWGWMGVFFGATISLVLLIALWGSKEKKEFSREAALSLWPSLKATFKNRSFLTFALASLLVQYAFTTILAAVPFFGKYVLRIDPSRLALILAVAFLTAIPMLFVWRKLAVRHGAKRCFMASMAMLAIFLSPLFFVQSFNMVLLISFLMGIAMAGFILISDLLISDVIDEDELNTGTRREGMFFGVNAFIGRFGIALQAVSMSSIFILTGYSPYVFTQPREFQMGLRFIIAGFPIIALVLGFVIMLWYPLAGKKLEDMRAKEAAMHVKKGVI